MTRQHSMRNAKHEAATSVVVEFGRRKGQKRSRVEAVDWVDAGLEFLRTESIEHVKVERLAARLGISKGSFYWHFRNKADLHAAILERWKKNLFNEVIDTIEREAATASERLRKLLELSFWSVVEAKTTRTRRICPKRRMLTWSRKASYALA